MDVVLLMLELGGMVVGVVGVRRLGGAGAVGVGVDTGGGVSDDESTMMATARIERGSRSTLGG